MSTSSRKYPFVIAAVVGSLIAAVATPAEAQRDFEPLFDKFNFQIEASWINISTKIRLDSEILGEGTTLNFEKPRFGGRQDDPHPRLPVADRQAAPGRRPLAGHQSQLDDALWKATSSGATRSFPSTPRSAWMSISTQVFRRLCLLPVGQRAWAAGFGLGFRWMDLQTTLAWEGAIVEEGGRSTAAASAPLPYLYFEYRRLFSEKWRFMTGLGWLGIKIGDIDGTQWVGHVGIEYLAGKRWGFGAGFNLATVDVDWAGIETEEGNLPQRRPDLGHQRFQRFRAGEVLSAGPPDPRFSMLDSRCSIVHSSEIRE